MTLFLINKQKNLIWKLFSPAARKNRLAKSADEDIKEDAETMNLVKMIIKKLPSAFSFFLDMHMKKQTMAFAHEDQSLVELDAILNVSLFYLLFYNRLDTFHYRPFFILYMSLSFICQ